MKRLKQIIMLMLTIIFSIGIFANDAIADTAPNKLKIYSNTNNNIPIKFPQNFHVKTTSDGKYVYCLTYAKNSPYGGVTYTNSSLITDNGINYILNQAYINANNTSNYFIYQTALWVYIQDKGLASYSSSINKFKNTLKNNNTAAGKKIKDLVAKAKKAGKNDTTAADLTLTLNNKAMKLSGSNYVSEGIKVTSNTTVTDKNITLTGAPAGSTAKLKNGYIYVTVPANKLTKLKTDITVTVKVEKKIYKSYNYTPSNSKYQKMSATYGTNTTKAKKVTLNITKTASVKVNKIDAETKKNVAGAKLVVKNSAGKQIATWTSTTSAYNLTGLSEGTYTLTETQTPNGYILTNTKVTFKVDANGKIKDSNNKNIVSISYSNKKNSVTISKQDITSKKELPGATLVVKNSSGKVIDTWKSTNTAHIIRGLAKGTYTLSETIAPAGYKKTTTTIKFTIDEYGKLTDANKKAISKVVMYNEVNKVNISKQDITSKKELPGATLVVKNSSGKVIDTWKSTNTAHVITGLAKGTYTLSETIAPAGYKKTTTTIKFTIDEYGKLTDANGKAISKVVMYNELTKVNISKQDITTSKELPGAKLVVKDSNNKVIDSWTSTDKVHVITGLAKGTYTLSETIAPEGYKKSTTTIKFNLDEYGKLTDKDGKTIDKVVMYNELTKVNISKQDITTSKELPGAKLVVKDSNNKVIDSWTSTDKVHVITGLAKGTYTLSETIAPAGYKKTTTTIKFTLDEYGKLTDKDGKSIDKVVMYNELTKVNISKQDITTSKELPGAKLELKDSNNKVIDSWTSTDKVHVITGLSKGTYTLSETNAPKGYKLSTETITFTIDEYGKLTDKDGKTIDKVVMYNTKEKEVNISKQDLTNKKELPGAKLEVIDAEGNIIDSWTSTDKVHTIKDIKTGTYKLKETMAPDGYILNIETIEFTVNEDGTITNKDGKTIDKVVMYNEIEKEIGIEISKQDITSKKELPGAALKLLGENNTIIDTWISSDEAHVIKGIDEGTYTLSETEAPKGYKLSTETITFNVDKKGNITDINGNKLDKVVLFNEKEDNVVKISKQDITTSKELPGASLEIKDSDGNIIDSWISTEEVHNIKNMKEGTYTLSETIAPNGYKLNTETIEFKVDSEGLLIGKEQVVMYNTPIKKIDVTISKQDITTSKELPGASLEVKDSEGNIIESWTSTEEAHVIKDLPEGTYSLTETNAPDGYILYTETITFTVNEKGNLVNKDGKNIDKVVMYNEKEVIPSKVPIVKIDAKTKENLSGATFEVKDSEGNIIETFESTKEAHYVELTEGTYTITETNAPDGYILNETPITFIVTSDNKITDTEGKELNTIIIENTKEEIVTKVSISKQDITNGSEVPGAHLTIKDKDGNVIEDWISGTEPHLIEGLLPGEYTLHELIAPDGYILSDEIVPFTVKEDGSVTSVVMYNAPKPTPIPTPEEPKDEGTEIRVENTSSKENIGLSILGSISLLLGIKRIKRKEV